METIFSLVLAVGIVSLPVSTPEMAVPTPVQPVRELSGTLYAYTSTVGQTDASPFVTASGATVQDGTVANNCLPFGTQISFPELYGDKIFTVTDRMAARYGCNSFDLWFPTTTAAWQFGKQYTTVNVY